MPKAGTSLQALPTVLIFKNAIRENAAHGFIYLNNPKVGCSTIKSTLWQAIRSGETLPDEKTVHGTDDSPFDRNPTDAGAVERAFIFTFVRNPFQRVVSAYLNKVTGTGKPEWHDFAHRHGVSRATSFDGFIDLLSNVAPEQHDPHWRPQHLNTMYPFAMPNLICDLDRLDDMLPQVLSRLFPDRGVVTPVKIRP